MSLYQQSCDGQEARDRVVVLDPIPREELLTMPPEKVNAVLQAFNEGRTLEEAARLADAFLGMLGYSCIKRKRSTLNERESRRFAL